VVRDPKLFPWVLMAVTVGGLAVPALAAPGRGLTWLLFVGSSVHVAATFALFTFADVRRHARDHPRRYVAAPLFLVLATSAAAAVLPTRALEAALLGFFGWQLWHYQQQNLGLAALAARATGQPPLTSTERRCIRASAVGGILALVAHPQVTQLVAMRPPRQIGAAATAAAWLLVTVALGTVALGTVIQRRRRRTASAAVLVIAVAYPLPLLATVSPYAALGGMTLAHGLQYLLLVGLVLAGPARDTGRRSRGVEGVLLLTGVLAIAGGLAAASHLHHGPAPTRLVFGAYLGVVMTHFVVEAGLWRLRDPFPRQWLGERLPALLTPAGDTSASGIQSSSWQPATASPTSAVTPAPRRSCSPASPKARSTATH
jgi:hypothetical protein